MLRKFMVQLFLFFLLFSTWWELSHLRYVATGGRITNPLPVFPNLQVEMLKSSDPQVVTDALKVIARSLINYLEPELAKEIWECNFLFLDLLPGDAPELAVSLTLPPDRGVLVLLQKQNKHYILLYYLDNLLPLTKMESLALPDGSSFLATREEYKERTGAYTEARMVKLWTWKNKALHVVWSDNSYWEINWLNTWQNPQSQPLKWFKLLQEAGITYQGESQPSVVVKARQTFSECPTDLESLPPEDKFKTIRQREIQETYVWSEEWQRFIIKSGNIPGDGKNPAQKVAVLKDMENHLESLAEENKKMYEVIGKDGKIFLVAKDRLRIDP